VSAKTEFSGCPSAAFVNSSGQILLAGYLKNGLTYSGYTLIPTDDMIRFWRSKVKVTTGCRGGGDVALAP